MSFSIKNRLSIWDFKEPNRWYRIDRKIRFFFRKIKWMFQRAKYGYCDMDLWNLDYTLGNYIASTVCKLANTTHGYPYQLNPKTWEKILKGISYNFYVGVNEDFWDNRFDKFLTYEINYQRLTEDQKRLWDDWFKEENKKYELMKAHRQKGFEDLAEWFPHLWD